MEESATAPRASKVKRGIMKEPFRHSTVGVPIIPPPGPQISVKWQPPSTICGDNGVGTLTIEGQYWPGGQDAEDFCITMSNCGEAGDGYPPLNWCGSGNPPEISESAQTETVFWPIPPRIINYTNFKVSGPSCFCGGSSVVTVTDRFGNRMTNTVHIPCTPC
jgi:hypothetical protein